MVRLKSNISLFLSCVRAAPTPGATHQSSLRRLPHQLRLMVSPSQCWSTRSEFSSPVTVREQFLKCAPRGPVQVDELTRQFPGFNDSYTDVNFKAADLKKIKAQTLIVHGDRDDFFPVATPVAMYGSIPRSQLWIVPRGDHSPTAGAPRDFFTLTVKDFLAH